MKRHTLAIALALLIVFLASPAFCLDLGQLIEDGLAQGNGAIIVPEGTYVVNGPQQSWWWPEEGPERGLSIRLEEAAKSRPLGIGQKRTRTGRSIPLDPPSKGTLSGPRG